MNALVKPLIDGLKDWKSSAAGFAGAGGIGVFVVAWMFKTGSFELDIGLGGLVVSAFAHLIGGIVSADKKQLPPGG